MTFLAQPNKAAAQMHVEAAAAAQGALSSRIRDPAHAGARLTSGHWLRLFKGDQGHTRSKNATEAQITDSQAPRDRLLPS